MKAIKSTYTLQSVEVTLENVGVKLQGELKSDENGQVINFSGQILDEGGNYKGSFNYTVNGDRVNQNIDVEADLFVGVNSLIKEGIA